jgi:phosphoenolpyruvate-protein kinase (PTS system EI component)
VKAQVRTLRIDDCKKLAEQALAADSAADVRALVPNPDGNT